MTTPVSGPGQFSKRTDTAVSNANQSLPNAGYGENKDYQEAKAAAPMAADSGTIANSFGQLFGNPAASVTGLDAESAQPNIPVTDGAALGPGAGTEAIAPPAQKDQRTISYLPVLEYLANLPGSSDMARAMVRQIKSQM